MDTKDDKKDVQGRSWDQITKDGSSSAGSMGAGGTGDIGSMSGNKDGSNQQSGGQAGRTDDLLASDSDEKGGAEGFQNPKGKGEIQTGMAGIGSLSGNGAGNRQKDEQDAQSEARGGQEGGGQQNR